MKSREAIDTISGYYYQFDYFILTVLNQLDSYNSVYIEGIEDIDIDNIDETKAIQCKYYAKTEYNHSLIAKSIRLMLIHYSNSHEKKLQYNIYGYYKTGQQKLPHTITVNFAKEHFFTYVEKGVKHELHNELRLSDENIKLFLNKLKININAMSFEQQEQEIFNKLKQIFNCNDFEAEYFYYNNALRLVANLATKQNILERKITKYDFITKINTKESLYSLWFLKKKEIKEFCDKYRKEYFCKTNISPFERFFLIEIDDKITISEIKTLLIQLSEKWCNISRRQTTPYCPYVFLKNISNEALIQLKKSLQMENFNFIDGYEFKDADFFVKSICKEANFYNKIKLKIVNDINQIDKILNSVNTVREIYQFYIKKPYYEQNQYKHIKIPILETKNVSSII